MRTTTKVLWLGTAVAMGALALRDAAAGNYAEPAAEYYSLSLNLGEYLSHSDPEAVLLVDDVTYSCEWVPCSADGDCLLYSEPGDLPWGVAVPPQTPGQPIFLSPGGSVPPGLRPVYGAPPPGGGGNFVTPGLPGGGATTIMSGLIRAARGAFGQVVLVDSDGGGHQAMIDRFSISAHGDLGDLHKLHSERFNEGEFLHFWKPAEPRECECEEECECPDDGGVGLGISGSGEVSVGKGTDLTAAFASYPSSGSRHFQSPHVVVNGRVYLQDWGGTAMGSAVACVKGRVIASPATPPTVSSGVTVTWP